MFRSRLIATLLATLLFGAFTTSLAVSAQGNSDAAHRCQNGGHANYTDTSGSPFRNAGECVRYAAQGNELIPVANEPERTECEDGAWAELAPAEDETAAFESEEACALYVRDGGDPVPYAPAVEEPELTGCEDGAWAVSARTEDPNTVFASEADCIVYVESGGTLVPFVPVVEDPAIDRCYQEGLQAGFDYSELNIIAGTESGDTFGDADLTDGPDLICGFGGNDFVAGLRPGDLFLGGAGNDSVNSLNGGIFDGGAGYDYVNFMFSGIFNGGADIDRVDDQMSGGLFFGGAGNDFVRVLQVNATNISEGGFIGGSGEDYIVQHLYGPFEQDGPDGYHPS